MIFKILSEDVVSQGIFFAQGGPPMQITIVPMSFDPNKSISDMKLGHYFKIAPRTIFFAQGFAAVRPSLHNIIHSTLH